MRVEENHYMSWEDQKKNEKNKREEIIAQYNEKINLTNFAIWKFKMTRYLHEQGY